MGRTIKVIPSQLAGVAGQLYGHSTSFQAVVRNTTGPLALGGTGNTECDNAIGHFHQAWVGMDLAEASDAAVGYSRRLINTAADYQAAENAVRTFFKRR